jgi:hypothetical protein
VASALLNLFQKSDHSLWAVLKPGDFHAFRAPDLHLRITR